MVLSNKYKNTITKTVEFFFTLLFSFFLDKKRNKKIKDERHILFLYAQKALSLFAIKTKFRSVRPHLPHYYQRMSKFKYDYKKTLQIQYKGNTLPEVLIAIVVITFTTAIGVTIYLNIQQNTQPFIKLKASELATKYMLQSVQKTAQFDEQFKEEEFTIKKIVTRVNDYPDCVLLKIVVSTKQEKKISEVYKLIHEAN